MMPPTLRQMNNLQNIYLWHSVKSQLADNIGTPRVTHAYKLERTITHEYLWKIQFYWKVMQLCKTFVIQASHLTAFFKHNGTSKRRNKETLLTATTAIEDCWSRIFQRPADLPDVQSTVSRHWRHLSNGLMAREIVSYYKMFDTMDTSA